MTAGEEREVSDAKRLLEHLTERTGAMVTGRTLNRAWADVLGYPLPSRFYGRWSRVFEADILSGSIRVDDSKGLSHYAPGTAATVQRPQYGSDRERVVEALTRAVREANGAVPIEHVQAMITGDAALTLQVTHRPLSAQLQSLMRTKQIIIVRLQATGRSPAYYTLPEGPHWVRASSQRRTDQRWRACQLYWRVTGGVPFTTSAVRKYAATRPSLRIEHDTVCGWANGLQRLRETGHLIRVGVRTGHAVRWALRREWGALDEAERSLRLHDPRRALTTPAVAEMLQLAHDTAFVSRNYNTQAVLMHAKACAASVAPAGSQERDLLRSRPVSMSELRRAAAITRLIPHTGPKFVASVHSAALMAKNVTTTAIVSMGCAGRTSYFDLERTVENEAFIAFAQLRANGLPTRSLARELRDIDFADVCHARQLVPSAPRILTGRAAIVWHACASALSQVRVALDTAPLLDEERHWCETKVTELITMQDRTEQLWCAHMRPPTNESIADAPTLISALCTDVPVVDTAEAWAAISAAANFDLVNARELVARVGGIVAIVTREPKAQSVSHPAMGRRVRKYIERLGFKAYAAMRWSDPVWGEFYASAMHTLGLLRDPAPLIATLRDEGATLAWPSTIIALGALDTPASRMAVASFADEVGGNVTTCSTLRAAIRMASAPLSLADAR
jgi:hypothetical protein